jgi:hypothetical protein
LSANNAVATVEALGEHVHGATLAVGNTLTSTKQLANDGSNGTTAHQGEAVASVRGDDVVSFGDGVFDTDGDGLLPSRQVAETTDFLLLVQTVGSHFHLSAGLSASRKCQEAKQPILGMSACI